MMISGASGQIIFPINCGGGGEVYTSYCPRPKIQWDMHERTEMYSAQKAMPAHTGLLF